MLEKRVRARRRNVDYYAQYINVLRGELGHLRGIEFIPRGGFALPEAPWGRHTRWLTTLTISPHPLSHKEAVDREAVRLALAAENIDARPVWKPMHLQPVFAEYKCVGGEVAEDLFRRGLHPKGMICLPSGSNLTEEELARVVGVIRRMVR